MQVKPKLALLKRTLLGTGGALAACAILLIGLAKTGTEADSIIGESLLVQPSAMTHFPHLSAFIVKPRMPCSAHFKVSELSGLLRKDPVPAFSCFLMRL